MSSKNNQKNVKKEPSLPRREKMRRRASKILAWVLAGAMIVSVAVYLLLAIAGGL